jgi:hypothetical protein
MSEYLKDIRQDIAEHVEDFRSLEEQEQSSQAQETTPTGHGTEEERFARYRVNVLIDNGGTSGAPVVFEYSPTYYNLFGKLDFRPRFGTSATGQRVQ